MRRTAASRARLARADRSLRAKGLAVVALPLVALLVAALAYTLVRQQEDDAAAQVARTLEVRGQIQVVTTLLVDAETGVRGYLLTGQDGFLAPYRQAQAALPGSLAHLAQLVQDDPAQGARLRRVEALSTQDLAALDALRAAGPAAAGTTADRLGSGKATMDATRAELAGMQAAEDQLLAARTARLARVRAWGAAAVAASLVVGLLGGLAAALLFTAGIAGRVRLLEENARRLAARRPLLPAPAGRDELGRLGRGLADAGALLAERERELCEARAFLEYLIATGPGLIYRVALQALRPTYVSANVERLLGYTPAEVLADPAFWTDRLHPDDRGRAHGELTRVVAGAVPQAEVQQRVRRRDGRYRWFATVVCLERDAAGAAIGLLAYGVDVTARQEAEEALQRANEALEHRVQERTAALREANAQLAARQDALEELNRALAAQARELAGQAAALAATNRALVQQRDENEMFVYSVSHDLRSPLVNLQGFSQELALVGQDLRALLSGGEVPQALRQRGLALVDEDMAEALRFIQTGVTRLSTIIDALLGLSRAGRVEYRWQAVDVAALVARLVDSRRATIAGRGATVAVRDLPPAWGDPTALERLFANLLDNALAYLDPARPGRVEVGGAADGGAPDRRTYYVSDNGLGIPAHAQARIFQAFQRHHPEVAPGEGLGLALVRRIVERHGGAIRVASTVGAGSTFFVELPGQPPGPAADDIPEAMDPPARAAEGACDHADGALSHPAR
ncbi:MAG TPA: CHASE3 domain-containing protein [Thermomicrobiales bacterium]|nr:CHASE3 domain-containing protein [Thermomicrobiales bacterium]